MPITVFVSASWMFLPPQETTDMLESGGRALGVGVSVGVGVWAGV